MVRKKLQFITGFFILIFLTACSVTKHLKENETLYTGGSVKINNKGRIPEKKTLSQELEELLPKPNTKIFGMKPKLWVYYNVKPGNKTKGLKPWLRKKFAEKPVLLEDINTENIEGRMLNILYNKGYFQAEVQSEERGKGKTVGLKFTTSIKPPYRIKEVFFPKTNTPFDSQIARLKGRTLLKEGQTFSLEKLEEERSRIDSKLKEEGYFYFNPDFILFQVDSMVGDRQVNLHLTIKSEVPPKGLNRYKINEIKLFPEYEVADTLTGELNTVTVDSIDVERKGNGMFRPIALTRLVFLKEDSLYSRKNHNITLNRLMGLDVFKYVNIKFSEVDSSSNGVLNANIQMSPLLKKSLRAEVQAYNKSNGFAGPAIQFSFKNRNAFRGAEVLIVNLNTSFETQISGRRQGALDDSNTSNRDKGDRNGYYAYEIQPQVQLFLPRFLLPFRITNRNSLYVPRTKFEISYRLQNIIARYTQNSLNLMYGYQWKESLAKEHELNPINVSYINFDINSRYDSTVNATPYLKATLQDQMILGSNYTYTYNNLLEKASRGRHHYYFSGNADISGNLFYLLTKQEELGAVRLNQYSRGDIDFRYYHDFSKTKRLVTRAAVGVGYAYGASEILPLVKQFYVGGPSSLRAFKTRTIGPGIFRDPNENTAFFTQLGDMRIEGNVEYRFDIFSIFKGALFVDAGNTWLTRTVDFDSTLNNDKQIITDNTADKNVGLFKTDKFLTEIAVGTGAGLRVDVSFLVLRLDLAFPIRKFWAFEDIGNGARDYVELKGSDRWVFNRIKPFDPMWRKDNLVLNIAIGYPF